MPASKHRRRGKARPRWVPPPHPPHRPLTEQDRAEDALLDDRLHQLFGPPTTVHQGGDVDWSWEQTKARFSAVHMACLQEGLLPSLNRRHGHYASSSVSTARASQTASQRDEALKLPDLA
jgi:hypothetical protein